MHFSGVLALTPLWKVLGTKVGWFIKNSGSFLSDLLEADIISRSF